MSIFKHTTLDLTENKKLVFTALSKHNFYMRMLVNKYVLECGYVPLNPFMCFEYYLADLVDRDLVRNANNNVLARCDELWVFGSVSNGVLAEIKQFKNSKKTVRYFILLHDKDVGEVKIEDVEMEEDVAEFRNEL